MQQVEKLVRKYMPLAQTVARRMQGQVDDVEVLESDAYLGLVKAAQRFDPGRGVNFATYARPYMEGEILRGRRDRSGLVRSDWEAKTPEQQVRHSTYLYPHYLDAVIIHGGENGVDVHLGDTIAATDEVLFREHEFQAAIHILPLLERQVFVLYRIWGFTQTEVGRALGFSQMHVSRILKRAEDRLRIVLGDDGEEKVVDRAALV